ERLDPFLAKLPPVFRYAVEVRNPDYLSREYFACLRSHGVAHVYNAWAKMPELRHQITIPDSATADFQVCRGLLRRGGGVEGGGGGFAPYSESPGPAPAAPGLLARVVRRP